ncbi:glycosyltransferase [Microvirga terrestris]|uniref:Glycosyltransferase n=1 Tax=Microvirga terrestris TaxID=2791024 RepID=A0ABS0HW11_9HYPH|nr:glycosyltransferase [Microvirga terrestris]MBF9197345.1 glycosyltransferase [Microvirga terrestris]
MRVMVLSHGHPDLGAGGAERAAYSLFQALKADPKVEKAVFVARAEHDAIGHSAFFGSFRSRLDEILAAPPPVDGLTFQSQNYDLLKQLIHELIRHARPDVVHIHHFIYWGLDIFELFKEAGVRVVFTFHEYAAICAHFGQMIKTNGRLCYAASPAECSGCFPSISAGKFFVRESILKLFFDNVDMFVSPSAFLKERYVAWGVPAERIEVIENIMDQDVLGRSRTLADRKPLRVESNRRLTISYFGQINPYKGVDVLLEACASLPKRVRKRIEVRIHGENKHFRDSEFGRKVDRLLEETRDVVRMMGAYRNQEVLSLMRGSDWIVIPSIWWENSPIVIQEARMAGRPMIYADIGGMSEKADTRVDLPFSAGSPGALADVIGYLVEGDMYVDSEILQAHVQARLNLDSENYSHHITLYLRETSKFTERRQLAG